MQVAALELPRGGGGGRPGGGGGLPGTQGAQGHTSAPRQVGQIHKQIITTQIHRNKSYWHKYTGLILYTNTQIHRNKS